MKRIKDVIAAYETVGDFVKAYRKAYRRAAHARLDDSVFINPQGQMRYVYELGSMDKIERARVDDEWKYAYPFELRNVHSFGYDERPFEVFRDFLFILQCAETSETTVALIHLQCQKGSKIDLFCGPPGNLETYEYTDE